jgi:hypothetical protein
VFGETNLPTVEVPSGLQRDLEIVRANRGGCGAEADARVWFESRFQIARAALPLLPRVQAAALWDRLAASPCRGRLPEAQATWLSLLQAVARRDAARMGDLSVKLLQAPGVLPDEQRRYLVTAAMAGFITTGRKDRAQGVWEAHGARLSVESDPTLRLLFGHAFPGRTL